MYTKRFLFCSWCQMSEYFSNINRILMEILQPVKCGIQLASRLSGSDSVTISKISVKIIQFWECCRISLKVDQCCCIYLKKMWYLIVTYLSYTPYEPKESLLSFRTPIYLTFTYAIMCYCKCIFLHAKWNSSYCNKHVFNSTTSRN